jgi:hypothetical protein
MTTETVGTNDDSARLLIALAGADESERAGAARQLGQLEKSNPDVVLALERSVARDADPLVRQAALEALNSPANSQLRLQRKPTTPYRRNFMRAEIARWDAEGLIESPLTQMLAGRYAVAPAHVSPAHPTEKKKSAGGGEHRSLGAVLLSETSIKVALFLGAFFILAAALIMAALVEVARLPILALTTIVFLVAAGVLYRRLRLSSFIMFVIGALLIAVDGRILLDMLSVGVQDALISWSAISAVLVVIFAIGTLLYDSRLLSLISYGFLLASVVLFAAWLELDIHVVHLLVAFMAAAGIGVASALERYRGRRLFWPLFLAAQLPLTAALAASVLVLLFQAIAGSAPSGIMWLAVGALWLFACLTYFASSQMMARLKPDGYPSAQNLFAILSVAALMPVPLMLSGIFGPSAMQLIIVAWMWGLLLAAASQVAYETFETPADIYSPLMIIASGLLFLLASVQQWVEESAFAVVILATAAAVYALLAQRRMRLSLWLGALFAAYLAYVAAFSLTGLASLGISGGYLQLLPIILFFALAVTLKQRHGANIVRWAPPLALAGAVAAITFMVSLESGETTETTVILLVYAALFAVYAWLNDLSVAVIGTTLSLAAALHLILSQHDSEIAVWPYVALASVFYLLGLVVAWRRWNVITNLADVLRWSGLALSFLASTLVFVESEPISALAVAIAALLFTIEAFSQRNLWFGYPAALLYFVAYGIILNELDVTNPQFYSVVAALLGLIMHYLMLRAGNQASALFTGLVTQLILLSTTYVQLVSTDELQFFVILLAQALILLAYGIVIRSQTFVAGPALFMVVAVVTVSVSVLSGLPVALMIGCAGIALLLLGTVALWFRQRLATSAGNLGQQLAGWNW